MTILGKLFVLANLVLSVALAAISMSTYANSIDFTDRPAKPGEPAGITAQRKAELKEAMEMIPLVEAGHVEINKQVVAHERRRLQYQVAYGAELVHLQRNATAESPARTTEYQDDGRPQLDPKHPTGMVRINAQDRTKQPLQSIAAYDSYLQKAMAENEGILKQLDGLLKQDIELTLKLVPAKGGKGGLRDALTRERLKQQGLRAEIAAVSHLETKALVEGVIISERIEALDAQIAALQATLKRLEGLDEAKDSR
ncbi:MAG: hypothetical protein SNJ82_07710 [Gemmataceae bacterium]